MVQFLIENPVLLLSLVVVLSYPLGRVQVRGVRLGVAAVLFAGLAVGALHPDLQIPESITTLGLVIFVYTLGLNSGPGFFASFRRKGLRDNALVIVMLAIGLGLTVAAAHLLQLRPTLAVGLFAGSFTSTPALAGVLEAIHDAFPAWEQGRTDPVVGYSVTYPMGVIGMILAISLLQRLWRVDYAAEARRIRDIAVPARQVHNRTIRVTRPEATRETIRELTHTHNWDVMFGRIKRGAQVTLADGPAHLELGDLVTVVGAADDLERVTEYLGEVSDERIDLDRSELDYRRMFVSNPKIAGLRLKDLNLPQQFGAVITRLRRGDVEFVPHGDTVLELGDRVRVLTRRDHMEAVTAFFGDSYRAISEVDILTLGLGLGLGVLLGVLSLPLPGGLVLRLGFAGGPLIVALILGTLRRTGPMVWMLPYGANMTLRQVGLILFLAGVGTRAGYAFVSALIQGPGLLLFLAGALVTTLTALITLWLGHRLLKIPMSLLTGILAGLQTQPAVLSFASEQTGNDLPSIGYASVYPLATIAKILFAQLLLALLR